MDRIKYSILLISLWAAFLLSACRPGHPRPETSGRDSVYTAEYIQKISFEEPERALVLLDTAEERRQRKGGCSRPLKPICCAAL